jgi:hypothetical protein
MIACPLYPRGRCQIIVIETIDDRHFLDPEPMVTGLGLSIGVVPVTPYREIPDREIRVIGPFEPVPLIEDVGVSLHLTCHNMLERTLTIDSGETKDLVTVELAGTSTRGLDPLNEVHYFSI